MSYKLTKGNDGVIYVTLENGKRYRLDFTLAHHAHIRAVDEVRDDTTLRRYWRRRRVVSRDVPNSKGAHAIRKSTYCNKWIDDAKEEARERAIQADKYDPENGKEARA